MKSQTYLRLSLLVPYVLWGVATIIVLLTPALTNPSVEPNAMMNALAGIAFIYAFGIILWGIPYTLTALGLWFWSRGRPARQMVRVFAFSPFMLAILLAMEIFVTSINWTDIRAGFSQQPSELGGSMLSVGVLALVFGYLCIGIAAGTHKILKSLNVIRDENESTPNMTSQNTS